MERGLLVSSIHCTYVSAMWQPHVPQALFICSGCGYTAFFVGSGMATIMKQNVGGVGPLEQHEVYRETLWVWFSLRMNYCCPHLMHCDSIAREHAGYQMCTVKPTCNHVPWLDLTQYWWKVIQYRSETSYNENAFRTRSSLEANVFVAGDEHVCLQRQTRSLLGIMP